jgi:hypothetical protein
VDIKCQITVHNALTTALMWRIIYLLVCHHLIAIWLADFVVKLCGFQATIFSFHVRYIHCYANEWCADRYWSSIPFTIVCIMDTYLLGPGQFALFTGTRLRAQLKAHSADSSWLMILL